MQSILARLLPCVLIVLSANVAVTAASAREADTAAPVLSEFDFTPKTVDLSTGEKQVTVTARVTDATGAQTPTMILASDSTSQQLGFGSMSLISGDAKDGIYSRTVTIPTTAAPGDWRVSIYPLRDTLGNSQGFFNNHPTRLTVSNGFTAPAAPTGATAVTGDKSAIVSWTAPTTDGGTPITSYTITSSPGGLIKTVTGDITTANITGLTNGTSYTFTVVATNATGTSLASAPSNAVTPSAAAEPEPEPEPEPQPEPVTAPAAPTDAAAKMKRRNVVLTWSAPDTGDAPTGYRVASNKGYEKTLPAGTTKLVVRKLKPGKYTFFIASENAAGISDPVRLRVRVR